MEHDVEEPKYLKWRGPRKDRAYWEPSAKMSAAGFKLRRLKGTKIEIWAQAEALNKQWAEAGRGTIDPDVPLPDTVAWWRRRYTGKIDKKTKAVLREPSRKFRKLGARTKKDYNYYLDLFETRFGRFPLQALTPKVLKTYYEATCDNRGDYFGYHIMIAIRAFLTWCVSEDGFGKNGVNPGLQVEVTTPDGRTVRWTPAQIEAFCAKAIEKGRRSMMLAVRLAEWLAQRPYDVRMLRWPNYEAGRIVNLHQAKGRGKVTVAPIALSAELVVLLDATPMDSTHIIVSEGTKRPYTEVNFERVFAEIREAAGLPEQLQFRDFRRTGATEIAEAGATDEELRSVTGHRDRNVVVRYAATTETMTEGAMEKRLQLRAKRSRKGGA